MPSSISFTIYFISLLMSLVGLHQFTKFIINPKLRTNRPVHMLPKKPCSISVISTKGIAQISSWRTQDKTKLGTLSTNEMDTHADTCVAGTNWKVLRYTDVVCEVRPFTDKYDSIKEIPIVTVWIDKNTGREYLLVGEQFLWFGDSLGHSLINPNQLRANNLKVQDNPFEPDVGITGNTNDSNNIFIPFDTTGTTISFESCVPMELEISSLPIIVLTADQWDPSNITLSTVFCTIEENEMRTICSLTSEMSSKEMDVMSGADGFYRNVELQYFCNRMIANINIACTTRSDIDRREDITKKIGKDRTNDRHTRVNAENLARIWNTGLDSAKRTLQVTQQTGTRSAMGPLHQMLRVDHLDLHRPRLKILWFVDTLIAGIKSITQKTVANVFTQGKYVAVYPMLTKADAGISLVDFTDEVGIPHVLMTDLASEFSGQHTTFIKHCRRMRIQLNHKEKGRYNQNHAAEREIGFLSERWRRRMAKKSVPRRLWDFGLVYEAELLSRISRGRDGRTGYEELFGQTPNIAEYVDFEFYDFIVVVGPW